MKRFTLLFLLILFVMNVSMGQTPSTIERIEPAFWWVGMKNPEVQLMVHGKDIAAFVPSIKVNGVVISKIEKVDNPNYLFITLNISAKASTGKFNISFKKGNDILVYVYELKERRKNSALRKSFTAQDVIYLLMPDRFSNGNPANDNIASLGDSVNRNKPNSRHGGDIAGIENHLDYFTDLGVTALWINPLLENKMKVLSYHGYAITDFYNVDARFGNNDDYVRLSAKAHAKGLKMIMDMIFNHCGTGHFWMNDMPEKNWFHQWPEFTRSNFRSTILNDPYATKADADQMTDGWFDTVMPDFNQQNPRVANYLIQNSIWWIEVADLDGIRMDTYPYSNKDFLARWCKDVLYEYPNFNMVGETWTSTAPNISYWQANSKLGNGYNSHLPSVMDFPLMYAINQAFDEAEGWDTGLNKIYGVLTQDFVYPDPMNLLIFADNHDLSRFYKAKGDSLDRYKLAMTFLLTTRGIPQIYYGTEILMSGDKSQGDGRLRNDFPGGWAGDKVNAFTAEGRTKAQNEAFTYTSNLLKWRQHSEAVGRGKLIHYVPEDGVYVYARYTDKERVIVVLNNSTLPKNIKLDRYKEVFSDAKSFYDVLNNSDITLYKQLKIASRSAVVLVVKP
ncbi:MAG: glycoside hydrolase family 13 protein [Bacteroidetes bacterium]|nr:glycoside hydrolase family 13 protein [Bacteroidota bacterium]